MMQIKKIDENLFYIVSKKLGSGKYGEVFMGFDEKMKSPVAVKIISFQKINSDRNPEQLQEKLRSEIVNMQIAKNQHVLQFFYAKHSKRNIYMICELCNGFDVSRLIRAKGYLTQEEAIGYFREILEGFKHLHQKKIVHRDIKPANLLMQNYSIKIADLGLSKSTEGHEQMLESTVGSPYYMSPQIFSSQKYTEKTDIWSLGVILYEMVYGKVPWNVGSIAELKQKIKNYVITFPKFPFVTNNTKQLISRMLEAEQKNRIGWDNLFQLYLHKNSPSQSQQMMNEDDQKIQMQYEPSQNFQSNEISRKVLKYFHDSIYIESYLQIYKTIKNLRILPVQKLLEYEKVYKSPEEFLQRLKELDANEERISDYFQSFLVRRNEVGYLMEIFKLLSTALASEERLEENLFINCSSFLVLKLAMTIILNSLTGEFRSDMQFLQAVQKLELPFSKYLKILLESDAQMIQTLLQSYFIQFYSHLDSLKVENATIYHETTKNIGGLLNCEKSDEKTLRFFVENYFKRVFNTFKYVQIQPDSSNCDQIRPEVLTVRMIFEYIYKGKALFNILQMNKKSQQTTKHEKNMLQYLLEWKTNFNDKFYENLKEIPDLKIQSVNAFISKQFKWNPIAINSMIF